MGGTEYWFVATLAIVVAAGMLAARIRPFSIGAVMQYFWGWLAIVVLIAIAVPFIITHVSPYVKRHWSPIVSSFRQVVTPLSAPDWSLAGVDPEAAPTATYYEPEAVATPLPPLAAPTITSYQSPPTILSYVAAPTAEGYYTPEPTAVPTVDNRGAYYDAIRAAYAEGDLDTGRAVSERILAIYPDDEFASATLAEIESEELFLSDMLRMPGEEVDSYALLQGRSYKVVQSGARAFTSKWSEISTLEIMTGWLTGERFRIYRGHLMNVGGMFLSVGTVLIVQ